VIIFFIISIALGVISRDLILGGLILFTGFLCAYYAIIGKKVNYVWGAINYLLIGYVSYLNHLYGLFVFCIFIFTPLQVQGYISWQKNNVDNKVKAREFTIKKAILITVICIVGSFILGYLLSLIPSQRLAFLDAASNCINLCGIVLMVLRFKEAWWVWLSNNVVDLVIWLITFISKGQNSFMVLMVSIVYLIFNLFGIYYWHKMVKNNEELDTEISINS
jgi:nicotinamide mononucleotide transporter